MFGEAEKRVKAAQDARWAAIVAEKRAEEARLDAIPVLPEEKEIATELHEQKCKWNHTDGCGWFYANTTSDVEEWNRDSSRMEYLQQARNVLDAGVPAEEALKVLRAANTKKA